VTFELFKSIVP
jgi:cyclophilin family peptidyl-prolyl cis-trans isomerase